MSHQSKRKYKITWILGRIEEANADGKAINEDGFVSQVCLEFGSGHRYVKEILKDLENTGRIVIEYGEIFTKQKYDALKIREKNDLEADKILEDL